MSSMIINKKRQVCLPLNTAGWEGESQLPGSWCHISLPGVALSFVRGCFLVLFQKHSSGWACSPLFLVRRLRRTAASFPYALSLKACHT